VITRVAVKKREELAFGHGIDHFVNTGKAKGVFRIVFVEINIINTHSPFIILFPCKHWIGKSI